MNVFRIAIWRSVQHNGKFVTNIQRVAIIHARNQKEAAAKITLKKELVQNLPELEIKASQEIIYSCEKVGTVKIEPYYVYSKDYSPISIEQYKRDLKYYTQKEDK